MKGIILFLAVVACFAGVVKAAKKSGDSIGDATKFCEAEVPKHCISTTCPLYCSTIRSKNLKASCQTECNANKRCKLHPAVGQDDPKNMVLDAQNRDQLFACIAEKRDPSASTTGRRTTPWKELETNEFKKATKRA